MVRKKRNRKNNLQNSKKVNETKVVKLEDPNIVIPKEIQDQLNEVVIVHQPPMNKELLTEETDEVEKEQKLWKEYNKWKSLAHYDWTSYEKKPLTRIRIPGDHIVWPDLKENKLEKEETIQEKNETEVVEQEDEIEQQFEGIESTQTLKNVFQNLKLMHIFCVVNEKEEQARYVKLKKTLTKHELDKYYTCIAPTWKNTITDENVKKYIKSTEYLSKYRKEINLPPKRMSRAELSVILNHRAVLRHISKNYNDGYFLVIESDVQFTKNFNMFPEILKQLNNNEDKWDLMYIGKMPQSNYYKCTQEIISSEKFKIYTGKEDKTADAIIWKYSTINKFLKYMKSNLDFKVPYDTYLQQFYRSEDINFGWIQPEILFQTTFHGLSKSMVQGDTEIEKQVKSYF